MPKTVAVTLNEKQYQITELRSRENAAWRKKLEEPFKGLAQTLEQAPETELTDTQALAGLVRSMSGLLLGSVDLVRDLLISYAPQLEDALPEAYDSEILDAFTKILGLAYPFGVVIDKLRTLGVQVQQT